MLVLLFYILLLFQYIKSACVAPKPYLLSLNSINTCYAQCPWNSTVLYYTDPSTMTCVTSCPDTYFAFDGSKACVSTCPTSPNMTYYDGINKRCVILCPTYYYSYLGAGLSNQKCVTICPSGTFASDASRQCVATCPVGTVYMNTSTPTCLSRCPDNYYQDPISNNCKVGGTCPSSPVKYFADDTTNKCVKTCPNNTFADITGRCLIFCSSGYFADSTTWKCVLDCPFNYYRSNVTKSCLLKCTQGHFIDKITGNCTQTCTTGTFGDFATGYCESECTLPTFSDSIVGRCVSICSLTLYANNYTQSCVVQTACYSNTVGDPTSRTCVDPINCPSTPYYYANIVAKICTLKCPTTLWGDKSTKSCVSICPWNPGTYVSWKNADTQQCVTQCPQFPILYADNYSQQCMPTCPSQNIPLIPYDTFADYNSRSCVRTCPNNFTSQRIPNLMCISTCSSNPTILFYYTPNASCITGCPEGYFSDLSRQLCITQCPSNPQYYALDSNNSCVQECPLGLFADSSTRTCVSACPVTTLQYANNDTNQCVTRCPLIPDYYGQDQINGTKVCVFTCNVGYFADPLTRTCVQQCNMTLGYYGELLTPLRKCVLQCPTNKYADNTTGTCVTKCPSIPFRYFGNFFTKKCVIQCPEYTYGNSITNVCNASANCQSGFFADDSTNLCVKTCPILQQTFGEPTTRRCLKTCFEGRFADNTTRKCELNCNATAKLYKDPSTNKCVLTCPSVPNLYNNPFTMSCDERCTNSYYAYDLQRKCVSQCPSTPVMYANLDTMRCVSSCPQARYIFTNNTYRACVANCPSSYLGDLYADNSTGSCVPLCPKSANLYSFKHPNIVTIRLCVLTCPVIDDTLYYFSDNITQSCKQICPLQNLTWGDIFSLKCVSTCSRQQFRDNGTNRCAYQCSSPYYADNTTWNCVKKCPNNTFAHADGLNRTCLRNCPTGFYANSATNFCVAPCDKTLSLWSDNTTWKCVKVCPTVPDLYSDPNTSKCQFSCSLGLFADKIKRKCVTALQCSNNTIGDPTTYRCIVKCPIQVPSYRQESSNTCVPKCALGFYADNSTMKCVVQCPNSPDLYAYNHSTIGPICVPYCPSSYYQHLPNRTCLLNCPGPNYFQDATTMKCVQNCPDHYFAETIGQVCVSNCSVNSKYGLDNVCYTGCTGIYSADPTTYLCVKLCPFTYFSQNNVCKPGCTIGYADPVSKICQMTICSPGYYIQHGTHLCVQDCQPQYKYEATMTCLPACPVTSNISTNLYMDNNTYGCTNACLPGWYSDNSTRFCNSACALGLFADNSTGRCVSKCPSSPDFFGYQKVCYFPCPSNTIYAQNNTRECLSICPDGSFADQYNLRCMDVCTLKQYSYTYVSLTITYRVCVQMCPDGLYAYDGNKTCMTVCPEGTYGENFTNKCLGQCPNGQFADDFLNLCVSACDAGRNQFKDWSTNRCVDLCPTVPNLFAETSSRSCVAYCQSSWFALNDTRKCTQNCPTPYFADPSTGFCQYKCYIGANNFADNQTRSCVSNCPNFTDPITNKFYITYEDNSTKTCVFKCPFYPSVYGYNQTNQCVEDCPPGTFGDNDTRLCLKLCFFNQIFNGKMKYTYADSTTHFCVNECPDFWFADNLTAVTGTAQCTQSCTQGTYADNSTRRCVFMCPPSPMSYARMSTRQCIARCDNGYFGDQLSRVCITQCPTQPYYYYKDFVSNKCVKNCTIGYFAEKLSQSCTTKCSIGYYQSLSQHACVNCPTSCLTCLAQLNCTSCQPGLYMYIGQCIVSCPTFPARYYANDLSSSCTTACPSPYFGFNGTGKCELNCPQTYFNDFTDNSCKSCHLGCRTCTNTTYCLGCLSGYVFVSQYFICSKICNSTSIYFVNKKCANNCIQGTFLLSDLVTCQKCSTACATCSVSGSNCTKCANKFWYNYNCVDKCPNDFYIDSNNSCRKCGKNDPACTLPPLNFTISSFTKSYKLYAYVVFNRAVNLSLSEFRQAVIIQTKQGPIKSKDYIASVYNTTTYLVQFLSSASLNEMSLSVGFRPGFIVDSFGNGLISSSAETKVETLNTISVVTQEQAVQVKGNINTVSWILVSLLALMMIKTSYPLMILIDFLQILYMHLYIQVEPLPYLWMNTMSELSNVNFAFLPKLFYETTPTASNPYSLINTDITFLGNMQPLIFFAAFFLSFYFIFWALSSNNFSWLARIKKPCKRIFKNRMKYSFFNQIFYFTQLYVVFYAVMQWPSNKSTDQPGLNLALSIIVVGVYFAWLVFLVYKSAHYRNNLQKLPRRFKFLSTQGSKFPMDLCLRYLLKLCIPICLLIQQKSVQIFLLIILNLTYLLFNLIYKPFIQNPTNYINIFVCIGLITYQVLIFFYGIGDQTAIQQTLYSYALFGVAGVVLLGVVAWLAYRLVRYVKTELLGIQDKNLYQLKEHSSNKQQDKYQKKFSFLNWNNKKPDTNYDKVASLNKSIIDEDQKTVKNMLPDLHFNQDDEDNSDQQGSIDVDVVMNQFSYHMVPKKHQSLIKKQAQVFAKFEDKQKIKKPKRSKIPMIITIDQDELIDKNLQVVKQNNVSRRLPAIKVQQQFQQSISQRMQHNPVTLQQDVQQNRVIWQQNSIHYSSQIQLQNINSQSNPSQIQRNLMSFNNK